ncbi:cutinase family protein [Nocardia sp. NPDC058497]|uniref:cutinase family protein n=1 Tax=Nocardia sp. NPDC058497 TaxID=3346529 RepID=UPI003666D42B
MKRPAIHHTTRAVTAVALAVTLTLGGSAITAAQPPSTTGSSAPGTSGAPATSTCPVLYVLGVQSSEEGATTSVDTGDTGVLGQAFGRMANTAGEAIERSYIVFGSEVGSVNYSAAVTTAADQIEQLAGDVVERCPSTQIAVAGYAQGAAAAAAFAEKVGAGRSRVPAEKVAAVALLANPTRRAATGVFPGTDNASAPAAATGTDGTNVAKISLTNTGLSGAGIDAAANPVSYGTLVGRVADLCVAGDATCDVQSGSPLVTAVANISGQTEGKDPVAAIATVAQALVSTAFTTAVGVVNDDISGTSLDQLTYSPSKTLGQRLAEASSPTATAPTESDALSALFKIGTIGLSAVVSVAQKVFTATTIAELAAVGLSNPAAAVAVLGTKVADAVVDLVPPQSISTWVNDAFEAITSTITDTEDLYTTSATAQYSDSSGRRSSYSTVSATTSGETPLAATAAWFTALAADLATAFPPSSSPAAPTPNSATETTSPHPTSTNPTTTQPISPSTTHGPATSVPRP